MQKDLCQDFLHLYHSFGPNRRSLIQLLERFDGDARRVRNSSKLELKHSGFESRIISKILTSKSAQVKQDLKWVEKPLNRILTYRDSNYPALLHQIPDFPALLYTRCNPNLLQNPQIAIVGSRLCTPGGAQNSLEFARLLSEAGLTITSGMALGIDTQAHRGALLAGSGTIAITGTGLDQVYPVENRKLAQEILECGVIASEFPLGNCPLPANFPQRNRIISGLSLATLVVEAARRSGSLITARLAGEQGRDVFAIPGSIHNPQTRGCHQLIRDGARLVEQPADITKELSILMKFTLEHQSPPSTNAAFALDPEHQSLLEAVGYDPVTSDTLVRRSGLTIDKLSSMLLLLEINELIQSAPGGCYVRNNSRHT
jgi:DNA processing protein